MNYLPHTLSTRLLILREPLRELESLQTILDTAHDIIDARADVNAVGIGLVSRGCQGVPGVVASEESHRLAVQEGRVGDLEGPRRRVQRRDRRHGEESRVGRARRHDECVEVRRVRCRVCAVDAIGELLGHDGDDKLVGLEALLEGSGLLERPRAISRGQDADLQRRDGRQRHVRDGDAGRRVVVVVGGIGLRRIESQGRGDADSDVVADPVELRQDVLLHGRRRQVARLEPDRVDQELLLDRRQRVVEQAGLRPVVVEGRRQPADQVARRPARGRREEAAPILLVGLLGEPAVQRVGTVYKGGVWSARYV